MSLENDRKSAKFETCKPFKKKKKSHWHVKKIFMKMIALKVDMLQDRKIDCLRARPCIFQPGNFTVWDSEGVKRDPNT